MRHILLFCVAALVAGTGRAHDTWFVARSARLPGASVLALGTGDPFPEQSSSIDARYLVAHACRQGPRTLPLQPVRNVATALLLSVQAPAAEPVTCWAQLTPFELTLEPDKIAPYLDEVAASPELRARWAAMAARGLPWVERYTKHARVELAEQVRGTALPAPMFMDMLLESGLGRIAPDAALRVQVLREGRPLADFAVQLRGSAGQARWLRTDAQGRVAFDAPAPGRWLLRGIDLRPDPADATRWDSRFITLAFEVQN